MAKLIHSFSRQAFDREAHQLRLEVLRYCQQHNLDSAAVVAGLADVVATAAATLDARDGKYSLPDRMDSFCARVEETYNRIRDAAESAPKTVS